MTNAATPRLAILEEIMDARQKRAEALHDRILEAREKIRVHLHPESPSWQREAFDTLHAAHHILGGDPFDMHMRAAVNSLEPNERLLEEISSKLRELRNYVDTAPFLLESAIIERIDAALSSYAERKGEQP